MEWGNKSRENVTSWCCIFSLLDGFQPRGGLALWRGSKAENFFDDIEVCAVMLSVAVWSVEGECWDNKQPLKLFYEFLFLRKETNQLCDVELWNLC